MNTVALNLLYNIIDINNMNIINNKTLGLVLVVLATTILVSNSVYAQNNSPPPLENNASIITSDNKGSEGSAPMLSFGKITIQISQTEQIVIDLPIKSGNEYKIVPIK